MSSGSARSADYSFPVFRDSAPELTGDPTSVAFDGGHSDVAVPDADFPASDNQMFEVRQRIAQIEKEAYEKAFLLGEKSGREMGEKSVVPLIDKLNRYLSELSRLRETLLREAETETVELAFQIARAIVDVEVGANREIVLSCARKALERIGGEGKAVLRVHPSDAATVWESREGLVRHLDVNAEIRVEPDESVERGGCLAVTDFVEADATISGQFEALREQLMKMARERE